MPWNGVLDQELDESSSMRNELSIFRYIGLYI